MNARTETLAEVIDWLKVQADCEWECAQEGLSDGNDIPNQYREGRMDAFGWAATYCRLMLERERRHEGKERDDA